MSVDARANPSAPSAADVCACDDDGGFGGLPGVCSAARLSADSSAFAFDFLELPDLLLCFFLPFFAPLLLSDVLYSCSAKTSLSKLPVPATYAAAWLCARLRDLPW